MHLEDFVARAERFQNELVIASHFSTRYHRKEAEKLIRHRLPTLLDDRLQIWL
jgi:ribonuclease Z